MPQNYPLPVTRMTYIESTAENDHGTRLARSLQYDYAERLEKVFCSIEKYEPSRAYNSIAQFVLYETQIVAMPQVCLP